MNDSEDMLNNVIDPLVLEIFLFKNNYKDRLLITALKEKAHVVKIEGTDDSSFFVRVEDVDNILHNNFKKDILEFESTPSHSLSTSVTSIYFIDGMIQNFQKLKYFKINISNSEVYTRMSNDLISFDYRVIHSKLDLPSFCSHEFINICKELFSIIGVYKQSAFNKEPYFEIYANDLMMKLNDYAETLDEEDEEITHVSTMLSILGPKLEKDNPLVMIVVEP
jgi:hypothetical protein